MSSNLIKQINNLLPAIKAAQIAGKITETQDLTPEQADTLGTILYGFIPEGAGLKATATDEELAAFLLAAEAVIGPVATLIEASKALFE